MAESTKNKLFYGDNLDVLREHIADESIDLIHLDPSFSLKRGSRIAELVASAP